MCDNDKDKDNGNGNDVGDGIPTSLRSLAVEFPSFFCQGPFSSALETSVFPSLHFVSPALPVRLTFISVSISTPSPWGIILQEKEREKKGGETHQR
jgi:hypothetical protein